jgi:neutral ceramidase
LAAVPVILAERGRLEKNQVDFYEARGTHVKQFDRLTGWFCLAAAVFVPAAERADAADRELRAGAASVVLEADDSMVTSGGIGPGRAQGQEGELRAVAVVFEKEPFGRFAVVACDVLFVTRQQIDFAAAEIERTCQIEPAHLLVNATHTHSAPSTTQIHGTPPDEVFRRRVTEGVIKAVQQATGNLNDDCQFAFKLAEEKTIGQNSRMLLSDNTVYWIGPRDDAIRPTGPVDPELPLLVFRRHDGHPLALIYNHSCHTIGTRLPGVRSPSFYGLAAQELEPILGAAVCFLEGASGSTHNYGMRDGVPVPEAIERLKQTIQEGLAQAQPRSVERLAALKRPFKFKVRTFDEAKEDAAISAYCERRAPGAAKLIVENFRKQRQAVAPQQGQQRETWLQVMLIGDVAIVGVPAELFTKLGLDIKRSSPLKHTYVAELANDWIGYLPDLEAHQLGGYQTWTGSHSYAEPGTGERLVEEAVNMLNELSAAK